MEIKHEDEKKKNMPVSIHYVTRCTSDTFTRSIFLKSLTAANLDKYVPGLGRLEGLMYCT